MADILLKYLQDLPAAGAVAGADLMHVNQSGQDRSLTVNVLMRFVVDLLLPVGSVHFRADSSNPNNLFPGTTWVKLAAGKNIRTAAENGTDILATGGADDVTLNGNNLPSHSHSFTNGVTSAVGDHVHNTWTGNAGGHSHSAYTDAQGSHAHRAWTDVQGQHAHSAWTDEQGQHSHPFLAAGGTGSGRGLLIGVKEFESGPEPIHQAGLHSHNVGVGAAGNHSHNVGMDVAGNHGHNITVNGVGDHAHAVGMNGAGAHQHSVTGTITPSGSNTAFSVVNAHVKLAAWRRTL